MGTVAAYASFFLIQKATDNDIAAAYAGAVGENTGFYSTMMAREIIKDVHQAKADGQPYSPNLILKTVGKLFVEFGPAEVLDSLLIRPATMGLGARLLGKEIGVITGKIIADVSFYAPAIISYEFKKNFSGSGS